MINSAQIDLFGIDPDVLSTPIRMGTRNPRKNKSKDTAIETARFSYAIDNGQLIVTNKKTGRCHTLQLRGVIEKTAIANLLLRMDRSIRFPENYIPAVFFKSFMTSEQLAEEYDELRKRG
jgi:hypothetical protein